MTFGYFDTSVLVKSYIQEEGSASARALLRRHAFVSSSITPVELVSAFTKKQSTGKLLAENQPAILARVREDRSYWKLVDVSASVLSGAEELIQQSRMRTLVAIHVASLATFQEASGIRIPFITADGRQREAARQLGMDVIWVS